MQWQRRMNDNRGVLQDRRCGAWPGSLPCLVRPLRNNCRGEPRREQGFTLVEVLVVVAVLGIIAAIVVLNVTGFVGSGKQDSANSEAHQVQTAVIAYMQAHNLSTWDGIVGDGSSEDVEKYLLNPARLQAEYTISGGRLTSAEALSDGRWADCTYVPAIGGWDCP